MTTRSHPVETPPTFGLTAEQLFQSLAFDWTKVEYDIPLDLVPYLVADGEVTLLGGHGGVGKGFLSLMVACAVAAGKDVLGHVVPHANRVLYYSAEDGRGRISKRMRELTKDWTEKEKALLQQNLCLIDASDLDPLYSENGPCPEYHDLRSMVETADAQLVIVDGASDTFDGNEIVRRQVRGFIRHLKRIHPKRQVGVLLIVHIDRASARGHFSNDEGYAGSAQWHNSCRRRLYLEKRTERDEDNAVVGESYLLRVMKNQDRQPLGDIPLARTENGFWQRELHAAKYSGKDDEDHAKTILQLIGDYYDRGQFISVSLASNATTGVYNTLKGDPQFPRMLSGKSGKRKIADIVRNLERNGELVKEEYRRTGGGMAERWRVATTPDFTLPAEKDVQSVPSR